ncbi:hypothetical protein [Pseudanabaena sp. lw0831]|uniref:hypothetical protein n=1 Tax=Pseudanabaena sp. lw0831 TaxID=1357935 RepID=UPI001914EE88|nr:hypothetical protein [Pseudanabaena sp. lw0831]
MSRNKFKQLVSAFFTASDTEVNHIPISLENSDQTRRDVAQVIAILRRKNVLHARIDNELWRCVFQSLRELRDSLSEASSKLHVRGPNDVKAALDFMIEVILSYLEEYETEYIRFMDMYGGWEPGWAHTERSWPLLEDAAQNLLKMRNLLQTASQTLNEYADSGNIIEWERPDIADNVLPNPAQDVISK